MAHHSVVNDPATLSVFWNVKKLLTLGSNRQDVPPNVRSRPEFAVAATPPDWKMPLPMIVEFAPVEALIVRTTQVERRYHDPDSDDTGTVCAMLEPSVVPGDEVPSPGATVSAPVAAVVI